MKKILCVPFVLFSLLISCSPDKPEENSTNTTYWDSSSLSKLAFTGPVKKVTTYKITDDTKFILSETEFDSNGNVTRYAPVEDFETDAPQSRWLPQSLKSYIYEYNGTELSRITVQEMGVVPVTYTFTYGNHQRYVPLCLSLQPLTSLMFKNLVAVEASDRSYRMEMLEDVLSVQFVEGSQTISYKYVYEGGVYPRTSTVSYNEAGVDIPLLEIYSDYTYSPDGVLLQIDSEIHEEENVFNQSEKYNNDGFILSFFSNGTSAKRMTYGYNSRNYLTSILNETLNNEEIGRMTAIYDLDSHKNWTRAEKRIKGFIDWDLREGTDVVYRTIEYR